MEQQQPLVMRLNLKYASAVSCNVGYAGADMTCHASTMAADCSISPVESRASEAEISRAIPWLGLIAKTDSTVVAHRDKPVQPGVTGKGNGRGEAVLKHEGLCWGSSSCRGSSFMLHGSHIYTAEVMHRTIEEKSARCLSERLEVECSRKRRDTSMRCTLASPQAWQMDTALADQAVVKLMRGPTCLQQPIEFHEILQGSNQIMSIQSMPPFASQHRMCDRVGG